MGQNTTIIHIPKIHGAASAIQFLITACKGYARTDFLFVLNILILIVVYQYRVILDKANIRFPDTTPYIIFGSSVHSDYALKILERVNHSPIHLPTFLAQRLVVSSIQPHFFGLVYVYLQANQLNSFQHFTLMGVGTR